MNLPNEQIEKANKVYHSAWRKAIGRADGERHDAGLRAALATLHPAPEPVSGDRIEKMIATYHGISNGSPAGQYNAMTAAAQVCIADNNAKWEKAIRESFSPYGDFMVNSIREKVDAPPAPGLREEIEAKLKAWADEEDPHGTNRLASYQIAAEILALVEQHKAAKGGE